ncbi:MULTISPECIES: Na+/H+ antiporter subunit E [Actinomadura]|uniref:Na+/H+ antiporter subunit E n=1 Tax=Actinomadura montaniterrae TaxID=1803903 RepID=A0A6L3VLY8_9ACTN|nr:Na+/H+ antiporter subunit E [Actinomadura montaniterrae]KAB2370679.1 Na+/H+ antiporter subunit E [Actinomadura montaniterrae]
MREFTVRAGRRRAIRLPALVWLTVVWMLLWDRPTVGNLLSGLVLAVLLQLAFPLPPVGPQLRLRPLGLAAFALRAAADLLHSAGPLAWQAAGGRGRAKRNSVIAVPLRTRSDLILTVMAISLSATPGTLVLDVRHSDATLFLHVLGAADDAAVAKARRDVQALERRTVRAFGTRDDLRALAEDRS